MIDANSDGLLPEAWIDRRTPVHWIEPEIPQFDQVRDARVQAVRLLNALGNTIERSLAASNATVTSVATAFWGAAYGLGLNACDGISMSERAADLGVERAAISKKARSFVSANGLAPSWHMKTEQAVDHYCSSRIAVIERSQGPNGHGQQA